MFFLYYEIIVHPNVEQRRNGLSLYWQLLSPLKERTDTRLALTEYNLHILYIFVFFCVLYFVLLYIFLTLAAIVITQERTDQDEGKTNKHYWKCLITQCLDQ